MFETGFSILALGALCGAILLTGEDIAREAECMAAEHRAAEYNRIDQNRRELAANLH